MVDYCMEPTQDYYFYTVFGTKRKLNKLFVEKAESMGFIFSDKSIENLYEYLNPCVNDKESDLVFLQLTTWKYFELLLLSKMGGYIRYNSDETKTVSENLYSLFDSESGECMYGFENMDNQGITPSLFKKCKFFGLSFSMFWFEQIEKYPWIYLLNETIKEIRGVINRKSFKSAYYRAVKKEERKDYVFDDFKKQYIKYLSFSIPCRIVSRFYTMKEMHKKRKKIPLVKHRYFLEQLLDRYSYKGDLLFEKVDNLTNYNKPGIYILSMPNVRSIYIGQSVVSVRKRIISHFTNIHGKTDFDRSILPDFIKEIYVMPVKNNKKLCEYLDIIEIDLIANCNLEICENALAGGPLLIPIHLGDYKQENYRLSDRRLNKIKSEIYGSNKETN